MSFYSFLYIIHTLIISDNTVVTFEKIDFENLSILGMQLVSIFIKQIDGCIILKRDQETEFAAWFSNTET